MREKVAAKSGEKRSFSNYCKNEVKPIVTHGPQPADSRQRNHKLKLVLPGYNFPRISAERKKERRREGGREARFFRVCSTGEGFPRSTNPLLRWFVLPKLSTLLSTALGIVRQAGLQRRKYQWSLLYPLYLYFFSFPLLSLFSFFFRKTKISSKDITLITNSYEIVERNDFVDGSVFEVRQLFRILINIGNRSRLRSIKQNVSRIPR